MHPQLQRTCSSMWCVSTNPVILFIGLRSQFFFCYTVYTWQANKYSSRYCISYAIKNMTVSAGLTVQRSRLDRNRVEIYLIVQNTQSSLPSYYLYLTLSFPIPNSRIPQNLNITSRSYLLPNEARSHFSSDFPHPKHFTLDINIYYNVCHDQIPSNLSMEKIHHSKPHESQLLIHQ